MIAHQNPCPQIIPFGLLDLEGLVEGVLLIVLASGAIIVAISALRMGLLRRRRLVVCRWRLSLVAIVATVRRLWWLLILLLIASLLALARVVVVVGLSHGGSDVASQPFRVLYATVMDEDEEEKRPKN